MLPRHMCIIAAAVLHKMFPFCSKTTKIFNRATRSFLSPQNVQLHTQAYMLFTLVYLYILCGWFYLKRSNGNFLSLKRKLCSHFHNDLGHIVTYLLLQLIHIGVSRMFFLLSRQYSYSGIRYKATLW